jgi:biopolymer transport protein ExbD
VQVKSKKPDLLEADLTPMIDMVFQLIAFFMVLINFSQTENNDNVKLPSSELVKPPEAPLDFQIVVHVGADGQIYVGGEKYTTETLGTRFRSELAVLQVQKDMSAADASVIIRAHRDVATGEVQEIIRVAQDQNLINFALRVKEDRS